MNRTIFFSWQSDTPLKIGKTLIDVALKMAIEKLAEDISIEDAVRNELSIDKDLQGVPGSPAVVDTILKKISDSAIFVPDLTFTGERINGRPTPNPNVLIEYGWALNSPGLPRFVGVMNSAFGGPTPSTMPFDLAHVRFPITYHLEESAPDSKRRKVREVLADELAEALKVILKSMPVVSNSVGAVEPFQNRTAREVLDRFRSSTELIGIPWTEGFAQNIGTAPVSLTAGPSAWICVSPVAEQLRKWPVIELRDAARRGTHLLMPPSRGRTGTYLRSRESFSVWSPEFGGYETALSVSTAFSNGELWGIDTLLFSFHEKRIYLAELLEKLEDTLVDFGAYLQRLGVEPPFKWRAGFDGVMDFELILRRPDGHDSYQRPRCLTNALESEGTFSPGDDANVTLRGLLVEVCNDSGVRPPDYPPYVLRR